MDRIVHKFRGFKTWQEAKAFGKGRILEPVRSRSDADEYFAIRQEGLDTASYPYVVVWNEVKEG